MIQITFRDRKVRAALGAPGPLLPLIHGLGLPLRVACRAGDCGTCLVWLRRGGEALARPSAGERETLARLGAPADARLACQAAVADPQGEVELVIPTPSASGPP